jgi:molybdenum cofactor cytidylyltransferase
MPSLQPVKPTVIVLAAGRGERFLASGGSTHKLQAVIRGKTVLEHTLCTVQASGLPFHVVTPTVDTTLGMGDSIARGVAATAHAQGWLILPADLPMIGASSLLAVASALHSSQAAVLQAFVDGKLAHPVGFAANCKARLLALHGDEGARSVVQHYKALGQWQALTLGDAGALLDVDTVADLQQLL